jgi:hypothetical protein
MNWFKKFERRLEPIALNNLTLYIVIGQAFFYLASLLELLSVNRFVLVPALVTDGEYWRLLTFPFAPPVSGRFASLTGHVFFAFALYMLYLMGSALEQYWGAVRYNLFIFVGYALTVGAAFVTPGYPATNVFIAGSIFLAFAYLNPDFILYIFFILPVKIKWLALFTWILYAWQLFTGDWAAKLAVFAAVGNFLIFFSRDLLLDLRSGRRRMEAQNRQFAREAGKVEPRHRCYVCGKTDLTDPQMDFRYCSKCSGDQCYCPDHIHNHEHVLTPTEDQR